MNATKNIIDCCFLKPQEILSHRGSDNEVKLEDVSVIAVRFLSEKPTRTKSMLVYPLMIKLAFKINIEKHSPGFEEELKEIVKQDKEIGSWTLVHDVVEGEIPTWRIAAEIRPEKLDKITWLEKDKNIISIDIEGAAVFIGG